MLPSLIFWLIDRCCRLMTTGLCDYHTLNSGDVGFRARTAHITLFPDLEYGDVHRLDLANIQDP